MQLSWCVLSLSCLTAASVAAFAIPDFSQDSGDIARRASFDSTYDYVIVGSGPGGAPLASRLAIAGKKVLLIEAGDDQGLSTEYQVPALNLQSTEYEPMRWDYYVNHHSNLDVQKRDSKMSYRTSDGGLYTGLAPSADAKPLGVLYPRSGTLGGCAAHNALITVYPHASDWNKLATLTGDSSWSASNMRQYFKRLESARYLPNAIIGHGFDGWLTTSVTDLGLVIKDLKLLTVIVSAASAMGSSFLGLVLSTVNGLGQVLLRDINADTAGRDSAEGLYQVPITVKDGIRVGPREFVLDTANAKNSDGSRKYHLDVMMNTLKPRAVGVDFISGKSLYAADPRAKSGASSTAGSVNASAEVILAAGAFNTPQLLKLSGVGPKAELDSFHIPVIVNLPGVGTNLQDRYETTVIGETESDFEIIKGCTFGRDGDPCLSKWKTSDKGIYASNGISLGVVKKSSVAATNDPDLFIAGAPVAFRGYYPGYAANATSDRKHWSWITLKAHTSNKAGTVSLRSTDPRDMPQIDFNYFQQGADADRKAVVEGMKLSRKMLSDVIPLAGGFKEVWPGPSVSDADLADWVTNEAWGHHASCTCPIGKDTDPLAVLDSKFRVRGTEGLRVVDASVFPEIPGFYIAVSVYMVSEKAATVILGQ
ncbi:hypothetical protein NLU13_6649 [Sarocladium strictum]|uniref:Glucose-methanol-choline oxidoreductase N-terminal domain-containing protein n=1 Tax=Sarocladium strictum TaxID=5046 RepID=A0AA39GGA5_SARSR|nr:hypothetical protein NLU13_6649 [Sarocladium strictum]